MQVESWYTLKRRGLFVKRVLLLHNNIHPHIMTAQYAVDKVKGWLSN